jgi:hypothetical protein
MLPMAGWPSPMRIAGDMLALAGQIDQMEMGNLVDDTLRRCPLGRASRRTGRTPSADLPGVRPARRGGRLWSWRKGTAARAETGAGGSGMWCCLLPS